MQNCRRDNLFAYGACAHFHTYFVENGTINLKLTIIF